MTWERWVVFACVIVVILAVFLARRSAGKKRLEAISGALAAAKASGHAEASVEFEQKQALAAQARAENTNVVMVGRESGGADRELAAVLERLRHGDGSGVVDREGLNRGELDSLGTGDRTVPVDVRVGGRPVVAGVRAGLVNAEVQGRMSLADALEVLQRANPDFVLERAKALGVVPGDFTTDL